MDAQELKLGIGAGDLTIDIIFGYAQFGSYDVNIYDENGQNGKEIARGSNTQNRDVEVVSIGPVSDLDGKIIDWDLTISAAETGPGQFYSATVIFRQGGTIVPGGTWQKSGPLQDTKSLYGLFKLVVS